MADGITFDMSGLGDLEVALKQLEQATQKKILRKAVRVGMQPVMEDVKVDIRTKWGDESGALQDSVRIKTSIPNKTNWAQAIGTVGVFRIKSVEVMANQHYKELYGRTGYIGATTLAYWWEKGTQPHSLGKRSKSERGKDTGGGTHPGKSPKPVLRPAMDRNVEIVTRRTGNVLADEIDKVVSKGK